MVTNESRCHIPGRRGCDNHVCEKSACKFSPPHSRQAARDVIVRQYAPVPQCTADSRTLPRRRPRAVLCGPQHQAPWLSHLRVSVLLCGPQQQTRRLEVDGPCCGSLGTGRHRCGLCTTGKIRRDRAWNRSSRQSHRHVLLVAMDHACTTALYLLHFHAAGLHTVSCGTLAHLVCCCCCCAVPVPVWSFCLSRHAFIRGDHLGVS